MNQELMKTYLLSLPDAINQETVNNTKDTAENEERLLVLS